MERELRIKKLEEIQKTQEAYMTGIRIRYGGEIKTFEAYKIPLEFLIYNKYNGRIGSLVKSFERQNHSLDAENPDDIAIIEKFLWDSKPARNKDTESSLASDGQQKYGIVTNDGIIIDGNRRASILNKIYREREAWQKQKRNVDHCQYFIAVILPKDANDPKEISRLETTYQMGEDEKLDYNPIEKYLKCKDLKEKWGFSVVDIAKMMGETKSKIEEWLEIMDLMDEYLTEYEYDGIYTRLDKREGQFVNLNDYINQYHRNKSRRVNWKYDQGDVADLKLVCFDYIRAQYEGKEFRYIARPSKKEGIFCNEVIWKTFLEDHEKVTEQIEEKSVEEYRVENPGEDLSNLLQGRDADWTKKARGLLQGNLNKSVRRLEDMNQANEPVELLVRAINTLSSINPDINTFYSEEVDNLLVEVNRIAHEFRKIIRRNRRRE